MNLKDTITTNKAILALIESKYTGPASIWPVTPETRYYTRLLRETNDAQTIIERADYKPLPQTE